ncbi:hypothetical protein SELMODRAFT_80645 [Selaginella moellendorffii]|uniref:U3 small nucleolar RNA-associated protein 13 C-terminal domain-containing protein n=1 Tax=Selaginella moellendorffii TaxID=88036 RepID=D8QY94_SELML|nr:hypothetical protein SELMODRAFT_80645 [Selaginella moellendorffii]
MAPLGYKKNFRATPALQLFYTGGPLRLAPDASFLACACNDEVKIVDIATGTIRKSLAGDSEAITALAISPDGNTLFAASRSLQVRIWDLATGTLCRSWKAHDGSVTDMDVSMSGLLATASIDRSIRVWDVDGGFCTHAFRGHKGIVTKVIFHPDPHRLLLFSGGDDATVRVWDLVTKKSAALLEKHFSTVTSLAVSANGWSLISGARDKVLNIWSLRDYSHEGTVPVFEAVEAICVVPDGCNLPGSSIQKKKGSKPNVLTVGELGVIRVFSAEGGNCVYKQNSSDVSIATEDADETKRGFTAAYILPDAKGVLCITYDHRLFFYEPFLVDDKQRDLRISKRLIGCNDEITDLRYVGSDETSLAVASNVEQVRIYDLSSMACTQELTGHTDIVLCLDTCLSSQGKSVLASGGKDHTARLWDVTSGKCFAMCTGHSAAVGAIAFSKKKRSFLLTGSRDRSIKFWDFQFVIDDNQQDRVAKLSCIRSAAAHDKDINSLSVAPNDSLLCSGSQDGTARIWKLPELTLATTLKGHKRGVWSVEFSPIDQCVLTSSGDKTIRIWALSDGSCLKTFEGHTASVLRASFLSRGTQIISSGADGLVKLWTIKSNECINTFDQHNDKIWALAVNSNNESFATGGGDALVTLWEDCTASDEEEAARQEAEEALKDQDLANALADTDYDKAVQLAFELRRPFKLLGVFTDLGAFGRSGTDATLASLLKKLDSAYLRLLLEYIREWNSKPKFCYVAQHVLHCVFNVFPASEIVEVPGISELLEGILPYTQRHFNRIGRLEQSCYLADYTLACMSVLDPSDQLPGLGGEIHAKKKQKL